MKPSKQISSILTGLVLTVALASAVPSAHANVYATNIKINGNLTGSASVAAGAGATITYILNDAASLGVHVQILSGATPIRTIAIASPNPGTTRGLNTVVWDGKDDSNAVVPSGNYTVQIQASASGYGDWTQISNDADPGQAAFYPWGMDVDRNTNSPYYGRVVMGCATGTGDPPQKDGLYKMNADGSVADEGWFGYANYTTDDYGDTATGQMPNAVASQSWHRNPATVRIGEDDRIYWCDQSAIGAVLACDMQATTNQVVITEGTYSSPPDIGHLGGPNNYQNCPQVTDLDVGGVGVREFDVCGLGTTNAAIYLVDWGDFPSWGVWMWHLTNGVADPNDTVGVRCIATGGSDFAVTSAGIMVDHNLDIFVSQNRQNAGDSLYRTFAFTNWNGGALPPSGGSGFGSEANVLGTPAWQVGSANDSMRTVYETVIDSRDHPTLVAQVMDGGSGGAGTKGIRLLSVTDGSTVKDNLDSANGYNGAAFDAVGNAYGCSRYNNKWRVWSPPGQNQATTPAVVGLTVTAPLTQPVITSISVSGVTVTINFTGGATDLPTAFTLLSSATVNPASSYTPAAGAIITGSAGSYTATVATSVGNRFYRIMR